MSIWIEGKLKYDDYDVVECQGCRGPVMNNDEVITEIGYYARDDEFHLEALIYHSGCVE